jgi:hypothetical protein
MSLTVHEDLLISNECFRFSCSHCAYGVPPTTLLLIQTSRWYHRYRNHNKMTDKRLLLSHHAHAAGRTTRVFLQNAVRPWAEHVWSPPARGPLPSFLLEFVPVTAMRRWLKRTLNVVSHPPRLKRLCLRTVCGSQPYQRRVHAVQRRRTQRLHQPQDDQTTLKHAMYTVVYSISL